MRDNGCMSGRWSRVARGVAVALAASYVAVFAHVLGGGPVPSWQGILATVVLGVPICTALSGRRLRWLQTAAGVAASQYLFHGLFSVAPSRFGDEPAVGHGAHGMVQLPLAADLPVDGMALSHAGAAVLTFGLLQLAEAVADWLSRVATRIHERVVASIRLIAVAPVSRPVRTLLSWLERPALTARTVLTAPRRGPPVAA